VVDQRDLQCGTFGLGTSGRIGRGGGQSQRFDEMTAADLAPIELVELGCDETFHDDLPRIISTGSLLRNWRAAPGN
jgi:hypothetical protein